MRLPQFKRIEISRGDAPFAEGEFEMLVAGDKFRVTDPPGDDAIYTCASDAFNLGGGSAVKISRKECPGDGAMPAKDVTMTVELSQSAREAFNRLIGQICALRDELERLNVEDGARIGQAVDDCIHRIRAIPGAIETVECRLT